MMKRRVFVGVMAQAAVSTLWARSLMKFTLGMNNNNQWQIQQFKDAGLAHFSYAILAGKKLVLVDPARDPEPYYQFAAKNDAVITGIIETHPHADFVSSHLEIAERTGAVIYTSGLMKPSYKHTAFDEGDILHLSSSISLRSLYTPGHAPDAISVVLTEDGTDKLVFTGDSLLIGDVGRPDLREYNGDVASQRKRLAGLMYHTIHDTFNKLSDDVVVYPAHGAGSLCGKNMRDAASSTIGEEKRLNYAFQEHDKNRFVESLLKDLPAVPLYFPYDVSLNLKGAPVLHKSISAVQRLKLNYQPAAGAVIIDVRPAAAFKLSHIPGAYNLQNAIKFETWLGSVIPANRYFYLVSENEQVLNEVLLKAAKIGYESNIQGAFLYTASGGETSDVLNRVDFKQHPDRFTVIDVRTEKEAKAHQLLPGAINIPVNELESRYHEIPKDKPVVVHCASGYRSALGSSILKGYISGHPVYDYGAPE